MNKQNRFLIILLFFIESAIVMAHNVGYNKNLNSRNENGLQNHENELNLKFLDVATGYAIIPENIEISQKDDIKTKYKISNKKISQNGTISLTMRNGMYDVVVNAKGYKSLTTDLELNNQTLNVNLNLEPLALLDELTPTHIQTLHRTDAMVIIGFVADDFSGKPLGKVTIYTADKKVRTSSNENGFFQIIIPLPENNNAVENRGTLFFIKNNYVTEVRQKFDLYPKGDLGFKIRMKKGKGINKENIIEDREVTRITIDKITDFLPIEK